MAVANELTGEVAEFLLSNEKLENPRRMQQVLLAFQSTLRSLSLEARQRRRAKLCTVPASFINQSTLPTSH